MANHARRVMFSSMERVEVSIDRHPTNPPF
jgi:hypothetical protein